MSRRLDLLLVVAGTIVLAGGLWWIWIGGGDDGERGAPPTGGTVPGEIETAARNLLAGELDVDPEEFRLDGSEQVGWPDAGLGCPEKGYAYAQVITPGYKLVFDFAGASHAVHTNADGAHMVVCRDGP